MLCRFFTSRAFRASAAPVPHSAMTLHVVTPCRISSTSAAPQWAYPMAPNRADSHNGTALKLSLRAQKRSDFCFCGRWIAAAGQIPQRVDRRSGADPAKDGPSQRGGSRKGRVAAAGQIIQRAGSARSGVSVRIHFATRFACDDDTVCVTECAPFWSAPTLWG